MYFPIRIRSVPLSLGGTNRLLGALGLPATNATSEEVIMLPTQGDISRLYLSSWSLLRGSMDEKIVPQLLPPFKDHSSSPRGSEGRDLSPQDSKYDQWPTEHGHRLETR